MQVVFLFFLGVLYESPHRIQKMLVQFKEFIHPERQIAVVRELSKFYEEIWRGNIDELLQKSQEKELKGEIVVVVSAL